MATYTLTPDGFAHFPIIGFIPFFKNTLIFSGITAGDTVEISSISGIKPLLLTTETGHEEFFPEYDIKTFENTRIIKIPVNRSLISDEYDGFIYYTGSVKPRLVVASKKQDPSIYDLPNFATTTYQSWTSYLIDSNHPLYSLGYRTIFYPINGEGIIAKLTYWNCVPFFTMSNGFTTTGYFQFRQKEQVLSEDPHIFDNTIRLMANATSYATFTDAFYSATSPTPSGDGGTPSWSGNTTTNSGHGYNGSGTLPDGSSTSNAGTDSNYGGNFPEDGSEPDARKNGLQIGKPENARENMYDGEMQTESFAPDRNFDIFKQVSGINMYYLNTTQIKNFYEDLWDEWNSIKSYFDNPMDSIVSLVQLPFKPTNTGTAEVPITCGRTSMTNGKGYTVDRFQRETIFTNEYIDGFFNDFNDYNPKSSLSVYLPYSGWHELDIDKYLSVTAEEYASEVGNGSKENRMRRRRLSLYLDIDYASGIGKYIFYGELDTEKRMVLDTFTCHFANSVPLSAEDYRSKISSIIGMIGSTAGTAASIALSTSTAGASMALMGGIVGNTKYGLQACKNSYQVQGSAQGSEGWLSPMDEVVFLLTHNRPYVAESFYDYTGRPDGETIYGNALGGFVKIQECYLETTATQEEINEIKALLKDGCFFPHT